MYTKLLSKKSEQVALFALSELVNKYPTALSKNNLFAKLLESQYDAIRRLTMDWLAKNIDNSDNSLEIVYGIICSDDAVAKNWLKNEQEKLNTLFSDKQRNSLFSRII